MLPCFVCKSEFNSPEELFGHIKTIHKICGKKCQVQCTLCGKCYSNFSRFKNHVEDCFTKTPVGVTISSEMYQYSIDEDVCLFEENIKKAALELVCILASNTRSPRGEIFKIIAEFKTKYISKFVSGIKEIIVPWIPPEKEKMIDDFIAVVESSFNDVKDEDQLDKVLSRLGLMVPLTTCDVIDIKKKHQKKPRRKRRKEVRKDVVEVDGARRKRSNESEDSEEMDEEGITDEGITEEGITVERTENDEDVIIKGKIILMPIEFQMRKFLELPNVLEKIKLNTFNIQKQDKLCHFIQGKLWKKKMENYKPDQLVLPYHFYGDGLQINNTLGPRSLSGEEQLCYFFFPTIPDEYQSRLENIFVAQLYPAKYHKLFSTEQLYNNIIDIFKTLAEDGVEINVNGEALKVFFVLGLFIADNKEQNRLLGFVNSFVGLHCCRYCDMHLDDIRTKTNSHESTRRNRENYDEDVLLGDVTATGVAEYSPFNRIPHFHVTESSAVDLTHDLAEGSLHTSFTKSILYFIKNKHFTLDQLNDRISSMDFGEAENGNRPIPITMEHLKNGKFRTIASEMFFFTHHITLIIGNLVSEQIREHDPVWQHVLDTLKFFDTCHLSSYDQEDIESILVQSEKMNEGHKNLFKQNLIHKCHLGTHYKELTEEYGPLRQLRTIRCEGRHKTMKSYARNTNSRQNISFSMGKKAQYQFALRLLQREGLDDRISVLLARQNLNQTLALRVSIPTRPPPPNNRTLPA